MNVLAPQITNTKALRNRMINYLASFLPDTALPPPPGIPANVLADPGTWRGAGREALNFLVPQPEDTLIGLMNPWYHGTSKIDEINKVNKLITREQGARKTNAAALGDGIYITNDIENAKGYVPSNTRGGVFEVDTIGKNNFYTIDTRTIEGLNNFEELRNIGLNNPRDINHMMLNNGFNGIELIHNDGSKSLVVYNANQLSSPKLIMERIPPKDRLASEKDWISYEK